MSGNESSELAKKLLRSARAYEPPASARESALVAIGAAGVVKATGIAATLKALLGTKAVIVSLFVGGAALVGAGVVYKTRETARVAPVEIATQVAHTASSPSPAPLPIVVPTDTAAEEPLPSATPPRVMVPTLPSAAPSADTLSEEIAFLDRARTADRNGDPRGALAMLDDYDRKYPYGRMTLEAKVLRMEAFADMGDSKTALALADAFLAEHPRGLMSERVRRLRARLDGGTP